MSLVRKNVSGKTVTLKFKTKDFENHSRSKTLNNYIGTHSDIFKVAEELLECEDLKEEVRLIGVSISSFKETEVQQLSLL